MRFLLSAVVAVVLLALPATAGAVEISDPKPGDPSGSTNATTATFTLVADPLYPDLMCSLDGGGATDCSSGTITYSNLTEGPHTFNVTASGAGGADPLPENYEWTVDTTPPTATITSGPASTATSASATFAFNSNETGATFTCSLDGAPAAPCTSPVTYNALANGNHTFSVTATDAAGNVGPPATRSWTILADSAPPDTTITSAPPAVNNLAAPGVEFSSSEAGSTFECSVNGGAFAACASPSILAGLVDGAITFQVRAVDPAGNIDPSPATAAWTRDTAAPAVPALFVGRRGGAAQNATADTAAFQTTTRLRAVWNRAQDAVASEVQVRLNRAGANPEAATFRPLATGNATSADMVIGTGAMGCIRARSVDAAGNVSAWAVKCTAVPYRANSASVKSPFRKRTGSGYFAGQYVRYTGSGRTRGYLRLQLTPRGTGAVVKRISLLATKCRRCGAVRVVVTGDGTLPVAEDQILGDRTINLSSSRTQRTRVLTAVIFDEIDASTDRRFVYVFGVGRAGDRRIEGIGVSAF